eukprot:21987_1
MATSRVITVVNQLNEQITVTLKSARSSHQINEVNHTTVHDGYNKMENYNTFKDVGDSFAKLQPSDSREINMQIYDKDEVIYATIWVLNAEGDDDNLCQNVGVEGKCIYIKYHSNGNPTYDWHPDEVIEKTDDECCVLL